MAESSATPEPLVFGRTVGITLFALSLTVGVVDAFGYDSFGVFTTNQAGNLLVLADAPWRRWPQASLAGVSLLGAAIGIIVGTLLVRNVRVRATRRLLAGLVLGMCLLLGAAALDGLGVGRYWLVGMMAMGAGCIAAGWYAVAPTRSWLTANTGAYLGAVRALTFADDPVDGKRARRLTSAISRVAVLTTAGFVVGVALYSLELLRWPHPLMAATIPTLGVAIAAMVDDARTARARRDG